MSDYIFCRVLLAMVCSEEEEDALRVKALPASLVERIAQLLFSRTIFYPGTSAPIAVEVKRVSKLALPSSHKKIPEREIHVDPTIE